MECIGLDAMVRTSQLCNPVLCAVCFWPLDFCAFICMDASVIDQTRLCYHKADICEANLTKVMNTKLSETLASIAAGSDQKQKAEQYKAVIQDVAAQPSVDSCKLLVDHMLQDQVPLVLSRQFMQTFAQELARMPADVHKPVALYALEKIQPRMVSFEESSIVIREGLAGVYEKEEDFSKAAQVLTGIDLDSGMRVVDPNYKLTMAIKIAMLYLEDDDPVNAEMYIKKAASLIAQCKDPATELQYKVCYARILDSKRRFLEAALRYYELSSAGSRLGQGQTVDLDELETALNLAITCTVLAAAGPQRSRMLATLYKDERTSHLPLFPFLEKVYMERILRREEIDAFAHGLKPHQMARLPDGTTVLDRAMMQHNLLSASKLYHNISIQELGALLGVSPDKAENIAADMINDGRMGGHIDQVEGYIQFDDKVEALHQWDMQITNVCSSLNNIIDAMVDAGIKVNL